MYKDFTTALVWIMSVEHIYIAFYIGFLITILISEKAPETIVSWIFAITVFPVTGMVLYLLFGVNWRKKRLETSMSRNRGRESRDNFLKYDTVDFFSEERHSINKSRTFAEEKNLQAEEKEIFKMLKNSEQTYLTGNSSIELYYTGKEAFSSIIKDIRNAKESILMEYFIWRSDSLGEAIKNLLVEKARQGVEVKLLFDGVGSMGTISRKYRRELINAGVEFKYFLDVRFDLLKFNYRNHRKMTIVDYRILHTGGMNLGEEYITGGKRFSEWRDTNMRAEGEIVNQYLTVFLTDWLNSGGKAGFIEDEVDRIASGNKVGEDRNFMQISSSGPDTVWTSLKYLYSKMISEAKEEILIQSPYFVPDALIINQLKIAALSGVKVKIMLTGVPDKKIPYWIAETYFEELMVTGVEIYRYKAGFLHCKNVIIDSRISTMGTCNFDMRSFEINYEVNTVYYDRNTSVNLRKQFYRDMEKCEKIEKTAVQKKAFWKKLRNSFFRVISPIM